MAWYLLSFSVNHLFEEVSSRMKINTKIILLITVSLILTSGVVGFLALWQINRAGTMAIARIEMMGKENIKRIKENEKRQEKAYRQKLIGEKKEFLKSQVQTAMSALVKALKDAKSMDEGNILSDEVKKAIIMEQKENIARFIGALRYGPENKAYFWINDMHPRMIMDPYQPRLNGKDLSNIKDPNGKKLFVEFVRVCKEKGEGFKDLWIIIGQNMGQTNLNPSFHL